MNDVEFFHMGITAEDVNIFRLEVCMMMDKCNKLIIMLNEFKSKMLSFIRLIYKSVVMFQSVNPKNDFENSKTIEDPLISKFSHQDFHIVMDLLNADSFLNGFNIRKIGAILRSSKISETRCKLRLEKKLPVNNKNNINENGEDISKNPYKSFIADIRFERFIEILNKNVDKLNEIGEDELMRIFFSPVELNIQNLSEDDPDDTRKWFQMLVNDFANVDLIDEDVCQYMSFFDHVRHLDRNKKKLISSLQTFISDYEMEFISQTRDYFTFKIVDYNDYEEVDYVKLAEKYKFINSGYSNKIENIDISYLKQFDENQVSIDCFNFIENYNTKNLFICKYFKTIPIIALFNFKQKTKTVSKLEFKIVGECFCEKPCKILQFQVNDCQFYNYEYLTLIIKENHLHINHESNAYLIQLNYRSLIEKCSGNIFIKSDYCPALDNCLTINITNKLKQIFNIKLEDDSFNEFESLIKVRLIGSNDQTYLAINGHRNLVYVIDRLRINLTAWEMDANEDDEEMDKKQNDTTDVTIENNNDNENKNVNGNENEVPTLNKIGDGNGSENEDITENENEDDNESENEDLTENENEDDNESETEIETETETETENEDEDEEDSENENENENANEVEMKIEMENEDDIQKKIEIRMRSEMRKNKMKEKEKQKKMDKKKIDTEGWLPPNWGKEYIKRLFGSDVDEEAPPLSEECIKKIQEEDFDLDNWPPYYSTTTKNETKKK